MNNPIENVKIIWYKEKFHLRISEIFLYIK